MKDKLIQEVATGSNQMTPLETAAYNFLLARSDRYGCSPTDDLVDFGREVELKIADELERLRLFFDAYSYDDQHLKRYIEQRLKGESDDDDN